MECAISTVKYQNLGIAITGNLLRQIEANKPFNLEYTVKEIYDFIISKTGDPVLATNYVMAIPSILIDIQHARSDIQNYILDSYVKIVKLKASFKDFNNTVNYLGLSDEIINQIRQAQAVNTIQKPTVPKEITQSKYTELKESAKPAYANSTTGQEDTVIIDPITGDPTYTGVPEPSKIFYYKILRSLLNKIITPLVNGDSSLLRLPFMSTQGVYLTAMSSGSIPYEDLYEETKQFLNDPNLSNEERALNKDKHENKGVVLVITNQDGKPIRFSDDTTVSFGNEGKIAYYLMRATNEDGTLSAPKKIQTPEQAAVYLTKQLGKVVTVEEARKIQNEQIAEIHEIRKYVTKDPANNIVKNIITGGSLGYVDSHYSIKITFAKLIFENDHPFTPQFQEEREGPFFKNAVYFYYPGIQTPFLLQRKEFTPELADKVITLLTEEILIKTPKGELVPLNAYEKVKFAKNYIQTTAEGIDISASEDGKKLNIIVKGKLLDLSNKETTKKVLMEYLTRYTPGEIVKKPSNENLIIDANTPGWENKLRQGSIVKTIDANDKEVYTKYTAAQININRRFLNRMEDFQDYNLETSGDKTIINITDKHFKDYLGEHTYINSPVNTEGKLVSLNGYFTFSPVDGELNKTKPIVEISEPKITKTEVEQAAPSIADQTQKDIEDHLNSFNKLTDQKKLNKQATEEQISAAKTWYENSPLAKHFPFQTMFNMINTANPNGVASWAIHGITLYAGADYTDLYHEAWHGFTQGFLTKEQKNDMYNELRKHSGSFVTYQGKTVSFKTAGVLELEEYLAEDFRSYVLSGGKKLTDPKRNSIFRKILDFFKALFGDTTVSQMLVNENAISTIHNLYEKLRVGDLNEYTFSADNVNFNILNKGLEAIDSNEPIKALSYQDSRLLVDSIDSLISELIDIKNTRESTNRFTSSVTNSIKGRTAAYKYAQLRLGQIRNNFATQLESTEDQFSKDRIQKKIDLLDYALRNFGDPEKPMEIGKGMIGYHNLKSKYLPLDELIAEIESSDNEDAQKGREGYNRNGNESSLFELASKNIMYLIRSLNAVELDGTVKKNELGINKLVELDIVWNRLAKVLEGTQTPELMYAKIKKESNIFPVFKQLLSKLGTPDTISSQEFNMWTSFWDAFNKTRIPLIQMTLDKETDVLDQSDDLSNDIAKSTFIAKIGQSSTDFKKAGQAWNNLFQVTDSNPYIKRNPKTNINYLDTAAVLKDFPASTIKDRAFDFFKAIGVELSDNEKIRQSVMNGTGKAAVIRTVLSNLNQRGIVIERVTDIFKTQLPATKDLYELRGESGNLNNLMKEETRYSDQYSNFSVTNAEGNPQFEHSLNNSLTQMSNTINSVKSFDELISIPYMNHLDPIRNPYTANSIWINSLFDMNKSGRPKRTGAIFNVENLSGVQLTQNGEFQSDGIASSSADEVTKFLLDFHMLILKGTPELMRAADKGTSLSVNINKIYAPGNKTGKLYVDTEQLIADPIKAISNRNNIVINYIGNELSRIQIMENASLIDPIRNVKDYFEKGKDFQLFDDVLSIDTKKDLKKLSGSLTEYLKTGTEESIQLHQNLENDIDRYFNKQYDAAFKRYNDSKFISDNLISTIKNESAGTVYEPVIRKLYGTDIIQGALKSFVVNQWIHNVETMNVLYGDVALYNMAKEEFHKRNAGLISTGTIFRADPLALRYVNEVMGFGYAASKGISQDPVTSILNSGIFEDTNTHSVYYDLYKTQLEKEIRERYSNRKTTLSKSALDAEIDKAVKDALEPYEGIKTGDAQGWITFDMLRILKTLDNTWSPKQEELYQRIIKGETVSYRDVSKFFPVQKLQYFGPLHTDGLPVYGFHKFSVFPLIPSVIKGTNLEKLHDKMMTENIHYSLFKSGSKVSTITNQGVTDPFYSDEKAKVLSNDTVTKNPVFIQYLKNQLKTAPDYKGKITFSTQLRKLIEDGLIEGGVPTDYKSELSLDARIKEWNTIKTEAGRIKVSNRYRLYKAYEDSIRKLTEIKKKELLREAGWVLDSKGNPKGDMKSLLAFVRKELTRQDLADHQIDFIDVKGTKSNQLKHDLSISLSADKIEKLLTAIVNKRLIRQKVNGEGLIQVSGAGFEKLDAFTPERNMTNPTTEDLAKWGSNDLPTYHQGKDGKTTAMKVKIALQGQFEKLLQLPEVQERAHNKGIMYIDALNQLLKEDNWLSANRQLITMIGVRIPVQGLNSMEFMEVYEFLPKEAGNIIVAPDEIVAKAGSDFDIDKLTVMMPNFKKNDQGIMSLSSSYTEEEAKPLYEKLRSKKIAIEELKDTEGNIIWGNSNAVDKLMTDIFGYPWDIDYTHEELEEILKPHNLNSFEDFFTALNGSRVVENELLQNMREILELPENFTNLIRPNGTDIVKPIADDLQSLVQKYNPKSRVHEGPNKNVSGTRVLELEYNLYKHQSNRVGKETLGLGAVDNSYNIVFNRIGAHLNPSYSKKLTNGKFQDRPITLLLPHNTLDVNGKPAISLSHILDSNGQYKISDIISQLMNGWVDVAKDAWIFNIQGNKEVAPALLFMIQAGVSYEHAVYLVSQPLVREYINQQRLAKSTFADPLGKAPAHPNFFRRKAKEQILLNPKFKFNLTQEQLRGKGMDQNIYNLTRDLESRYKDTAFTKEALYNNIKETYTSGTTPEEHAAFLHYLEIEDYSRSIRDIKLRMNFDTSRSTTLFEAQNKQLQVELLKADGKIPDSIINNILENSPMGSFNIQDFMINLWSPMFKLRNNEKVNQFLVDKIRSGISDNIESTFGDSEKFATEFKNDFVSFIFQNSIKAFNIDNITGYKGFSVNTKVPVESVKSLRNGVFVKNNTIYVDKNQLKRDYQTKAWSTVPNLNDHITNYNPLTGLATVNVKAFKTSKEYNNFVFEREYLRSITDISKIKSSVYYQDLLKINKEDKKIVKYSDESVEDFNTRLNKITYEQYLRDQALNNTFNSWKMFESPTSYAEEFTKIVDGHPKLKEDYLLFRLMGYSASKQGMKNLQSIDSKLDGDKLNILHENLLELSNVSVIKSTDPIENKQISDFFKRFPFYAFMQSGMTTKGAFSLTQFVPVDMFTRMMEDPIKIYSKNINNTLLELFYKKFVDLNQYTNKQSRSRHKNYIIEQTLGQTVAMSKSKDTVDSVTGPTAIVLDTTVEGIKTFDSPDYNMKTISSMINAHPDAVFVYGRTMDPKVKNYQTTNGIIQESPVGFNLGIPTKLKYPESTPTNLMQSVNNAMTDATLDENKRLIDVAITQLIDFKTAGKTIIFDKNGYGQGMIGRSMRGVKISIPGKIVPTPGAQTFLYLSEQLYKNFGYINNNYLKTKTGRTLIQREQPVTDEEVREFMKTCLIS